MVPNAVFIKHALPCGTLCHRGVKVDPSAIKRVALMTVEGEKDDITGGGQTEAAHALCTGLPAQMKRHHLQKDVGHYGVFNGTRFRTEIAPRVREFIAEHEAPHQQGRSNVVSLKAAKSRKKA
jgi:poly(3-hydroxybutyrate) depolymerase